MAINNVYKPGWRSRRRSRLSLVERAIPKLGRVTGPENAPGATTSKVSMQASMKPSVAEDEQRREGSNPVEVSPAEPTAEQTLPVDDALDEPIAESSPAAVEDQADGQADDQAEDDQVLAAFEADRSEDRTEPAQLDEAAFETETLADSATPLASDMALDNESSPGIDMAPESAPSYLTETETETEPRIATEPSGHEMLREGLAPSERADGPPLPPPHLVVNADDDEQAWAETPSPSQSAPASGPAVDGMARAVETMVASADVQLALDTLVKSGVVDPRDAGRPLPANVDEVARALVRQALSDQSGWRDRIILVSSAREGRAKSMAAINFAFALTTIDRHSVVLLDANMDGSGVGAYLGVTGSDHPGLTTALCDSGIEIDDIALETNIDRLILVAAGGFEDDILDRFASRRMLEILRFLTKDPKTLLVLDAPPILSSQEATVLSVIAGQVALVVEAGVTDENSINLALKRIGERHNVSLVLSENSGVMHEEPELPQTPASRRLALPTPKHSSSKRRLRRAVAGLIVGIGMGAGVLAGSEGLLPGQSKTETALKNRSHLGSPVFYRRPSALETGGIVR